MKKRHRGVVVNAAATKTIRVEVGWQYRHLRYGKTLRGRTVCHVHDEFEASDLGDYVEIIESRPMSRLKRWSLVCVVNR